MNLSPRGLLGRAWDRRWAYGGSLAGVGAAVLLTHLLPPLHSTPTVLFFAAVVAAAWMGGRGPAVLAIILSTLAVDFFFVAPVFSLFSDLADLVRLVVFALVAIVILYLQENYERIAVRLRQANDILEARVQERTADLVKANQSLLTEVHERQEAEAALKESEANLRLALDNREVSLREKEVLFRELNHRVKNNLQIITSLISLQATRIHDPHSQQLFKECQHRVRAIALVHQKLCGATNLASIDLALYFNQLVQDLFRSFYVGEGQITPRVVVDEIVLGIDSLVPCALIVNELVCNAFKHAFPNNRSGEVTVAIRRTGGGGCLTVADDGIGFKPDGAPGRNSVGLQIVEALVNQLSGNLQWSNGQGTSATITFPQSN